MLNVIVRIVALVFVVPATYFFVYWLPFSLIPLGGQRWVANLVSLACAVAAGWYVWKTMGSTRRGALHYTFLGAILVGGIGFTAGFFGPIIFMPQANQGPLLGILITGPLGFLLGALGGFVYWTVQLRRNGEETETITTRNQDDKTQRDGRLVK